MQNSIAYFQAIATSEISGAARNAAFTGSIPDHYHAGLGPFLFEPYAKELAARVAAFGPKRVLEAACGTGIVTRQLCSALPRSARLVATDLHDAMIEVAKRTVGAHREVEWTRADMCKLSFAAGEFDAYAAGFGLMFVPDKLAAAVEARRVLRHGGRAFFTTWRPLESNPVWRCAHDVVGSLFPSDPPQFYRIPTGFGEPHEMTALLRKAGFVDIHTEIVEKVGVSPSARDLAVGYIEGFPMTDIIKARDPAVLPSAIDQLTRVLALHYGEGPTTGPIASLITTATAPDR